jgi:hypothetical protein
MSLSRRGFLFYLGLTVPAVTLVTAEAGAVTQSQQSTQHRKPAHSAPTPTHAHGKPTQSRKHRSQASNHTRRRRNSTA